MSPRRTPPAAFWVEVAGRPDPLDVFELVDCYTDATRAAIASTRAPWGEALAAYGDGDFDGARVAFEACAEMAPTDRVAAGFLTRCVAHAAEPPEAWDGVERPNKGR